jgi:four helix bundle protein
MRSYKDLLVWRKANTLAHEVYDVTEHFPRQHLYGLTSQLQRAILSVPTNIAEGSYSSHPGEYHQFLNIAFRSLGESSFLINFAKERHLISEAQHCSIDQKLQETERMLASLLASVRRKAEG